VVQSSDISASLFFRERSFSLIYFAGLTHDAIPELLVRCDYSIIGEAQYNAPFLGVLNAIEVIEGPRNNISCVRKSPSLPVRHADLQEPWEALAAKSQRLLDAGQLSRPKKHSTARPIAARLRL